MSNLYAFCKTLVEDNNYSVDDIAERLMDLAETGTAWEQKWTWDLLREAGMPIYARASFVEAAILALEIVSGPTPTPSEAA